MKRLFVAVSVLVLSVSTLAQGLIALDNDMNANPSPIATSGGLFFIGYPPVEISGDFNAAFYGGTDSANLTLIASFSGAAAVGSSSAGYGTWTDPTGKTYTVPGLENAPANSSGTAWFKVEAWTGNATSYALAVQQGAPYAASPPFQNPWASLPNLTPDLSGMPSICMCFSIPEPGTFALAGLGAISLVLFLRKASSTTKNSAPVGKESTNNANWCESWGCGSSAGDKGSDLVIGQMRLTQPTGWFHQIPWHGRCASKGLDFEAANVQRVRRFSGLDRLLWARTPRR